MKFAITINVELEPEMNFSGNGIDEEATAYNLWLVAGDVVGHLVHNQHYPRTISGRRIDQNARATLKVERIKE